MSTEAVRVTAKRVFNFGTLGRFMAAVLRGIPRFFIWFRGWLAGNDKAYLIEAGASAMNRAQHHYWCFWRRRLSFVVAALLAVALAVLWAMMKWIALFLFGLSVMTLFAAMGRNKPIAKPKAEIPQRKVITDEFVRKVIASATPGVKADDWETVRLLGPIVWDHDKVWWTARIELPGTVSGEQVKKVEDQVMAGFGVGAGQLKIVVDPGNKGIVTLSGTREDPWSKPPTSSPLEAASEFNVWEPIPLGITSQGRRVFGSLVMTGWLIGAIPRHGKTNLARLLALACALDPWCDLIVFDLKGGADWRMFAKIARQFGLGRSDKTIQRLMQVLEAVQKEIDRRGDLIGGLPIERCPGGHLTRELSLDPELDLQPIVIFIDEVQWALTHRLYKTKIIDLLEGIAKTGQFVGVWLVLATQRPDSKSVPTQIRDVLGTRAALPCKTRQSSETILGTEAYAEGWNAAALPLIPGIAILYGSDEDAGLPETVEARCDLTELAAATAIAERGVELRKALGRLPEQRRSPEPMLLQHARQVQADRKYIPAAELLSALNAMPEFETSWTQDSLGKAMRKAGCGSFTMNKRSTGDDNMPEEFHGRMGYKIPQRSPEYL